MLIDVLFFGWSQLLGCGILEDSWVLEKMKQIKFGLSGKNRDMWNLWIYNIYINDICQTWLLVDDKNLSHTTVVERRALSITDDLPEMEHCVCRMISNLDRKKAWWTEFSERLRLRSTCGACCSLCWYVGFLSESNSLPRSNTTHTPQTCSEHFRLHTKQTYKSKRTQPTKSHLGMCQNLCIYILWYDIYI